MNKKRNWLWEFSKKVVVLCTIIYVVMFINSCIAMYVSCDFSALSILISETSDILKTCVFGYFVKAGIENVIKINKGESNYEEY